MPGRTPGLGFDAKDCRLLTIRLGGTDGRLPTPNPPAKDCLFTLGAGGGPIEVLLPPALGRTCFDMVTDGALVFEGVPVRGVDVDDVAAESCLVGDLVGDWIR